MRGKGWPFGSGCAEPVRAKREAVRCADAAEEEEEEVEEEEAEGEELFDPAWGVVEVNLVASETDRGPVVLMAIVSEIWR